MRKKAEQRGRRLLHFLLALAMALGLCQPVLVPAEVTTRYAVDTVDETAVVDQTNETDTTETEDDIVSEDVSEDTGNPEEINDSEGLADSIEEDAENASDGSIEEDAENASDGSDTAALSLSLQGISADGSSGSYIIASFDNTYAGSGRRQGCENHRHSGRQHQGSDLQQQPDLSHLLRQCRGVHRERHHDFLLYFLSL